MFPKKPGANRVSVKENLEALFILDTRVAKSSPYILPIETPAKLLEFLTKEHKSESYIWNDGKGNLVGFFAVINEPGEEMELLNIWITPEFQRQGYGKKIMLFSENLARELGKKRMKLATSPKNLPAISFYKKLGYSIIREIENYYRDGTPRYLLKKTL